MQRKSTFQPWSERKKIAPGISNKDIMQTSHGILESHSEEVGIAAGDSNAHQAKLSRMKPKKKVVKLSAAAVDVLAGIPGTVGESKTHARDKQKREIVAAAILEKRKAFVATQFASPTVGASNHGETTSRALGHSSGAASKDQDFDVGGGAIHLEPDANNYTSLEEQPASDDVLEMSPTFVRSSGVFSDRRHESPRGSIRKPKFLTGKGKESRYSSSDEGDSDEDRVAYRKSKGSHRFRRSASCSFDDEHLLERYRVDGDWRQTRRHSRRYSSEDSMSRSPPRHRWKHREGKGSRSSHHGDDMNSYRQMPRSHGDAKRTRLRSEDEEDEECDEGRAGCIQGTPRLGRMRPPVKSEQRKSKAEMQDGGLSESVLRRERKRKQACREAEVERREKMGRKPYFLSVDDRGRPYGLGARSWRGELNKLCYALDPSVMDVRNQPHMPMLTLKKRLASKFEYSAEIDDDWLRGEIGRGVSTRRFQLMEMIRNGEQVPPGLDKDIWYKLERISVDPKYISKSSAMRRANSCRRTLGRTGPKGEMGIIEDLRHELGRSPDPDEIDDEMNRNKGYGGATLRKKIRMSRLEGGPVAEPTALDVHSIPRGNIEGEGRDGLLQIGGECEENYSNVVVHGGISSIYASDAVLRDPYVQILLKRVADLEARGIASNPTSTAGVLQPGGSQPEQPTESRDAQGLAHGTLKESGAPNKEVEHGRAKQVLRPRFSKGNVVA